MQILNQSTNVSIEITAIDALMNLAGELVLGRNPLLQAIKCRRYGNYQSVEQDRNRNRHRKDSWSHPD
jgi:chemotaxis protein histidine kinase CheA